MSHPRARPGGHVLTNEGEKITSADLNEAGTVMWQTLTAILARMFENDQSGDPFQGFVGDDCAVSISAGLTMSIAAGLGFYYDTAESDVFDPIYKPIWVSAAFTQALNAHDATNPRYDVISLAPATEDTESESRNVKNGSGVVTSQSVNKLRRFGYDCVVTKGTAAATPTVPSTPSGHLAIATIYVPGVSGAVTVYDSRKRLRLGQDVVAPLDEDDHVPGSGGELLVTATSPASMSLLVAPGDAVIGGYRFAYPATKVTISTAHATLDRVDVVVADDDGTVKVVTGTAGGAPATAGAGQVLLATITVDDAVTTIPSNKVADGRVREPISADQVQDDTLTARTLGGSNKPLFVTAPSGVGSETSNYFQFTIQLYDGDNNTVADDVKVELEVLDSSMQPVGPTVVTISDQGVGSMITTDGKDRCIFQLDANGQGVIRVFDVSTVYVGTRYLLLTPLEGVGIRRYLALAFT